jgi:hypothetical protein
LLSFGREEHIHRIHPFSLSAAPLLAHTADGKPGKDDFETNVLLGLIVDLLAFCVDHHTFHVKNFIIGKDLLRRVLVLLKSKHKYLALCKYRFSTYQDENLFHYRACKTLLCHCCGRTAHRLLIRIVGQEKRARVGTVQYFESIQDFTTVSQ